MVNAYKTAKSKLAAQSNGVQFGCHLELETNQKPDPCVKDSGDHWGCIYAACHRTREGCRYWQPVDWKVP